MTTRRSRRAALATLLLAATLAVSGCYYGPAPTYAGPAYAYPAYTPRYVYRPGPYYGGGYGYGYGYRP